MGEVYLAQDSTLPRAVAIKVLPHEAARDGERLRRFEHEARAISRLNHPNILTIHEVGLHEGAPFVVTELVEGETLRVRLARGALDLREAVDVAVQVASALAAAHAQGIVHRDVKPENIMIRKDGIVKVLDFGLAKLLGGTPEAQSDTTRLPSATLPGVVLGTLRYMSPEQARGLEVDPRTDIWSLGVVAYELLTGACPFAGATNSDVVAAILRTEPPPLTATAPDTSPELERIVTKALRKDREERYQDMRDLLVDLKALTRRLDGESERAGQSGERSRHEPIAPGRHVRRTAVVAAIGAIAALALALLAYTTGFPGDGGSVVDSVAVLPFANESGNPDHEYLSDGISESIINNLSQLSGVKVIARSSTFQYKGRPVDTQEAARALGVKGIVTGRVAQHGPNLLVGVELVDAADRTQIWGNQYTLDATDLVQVQAVISRDIAENLRRRLTSDERDRLARPETLNQQAYELALQGRFHARQGGLEHQKTAVEYFERAIALDPAYAHAYVGLANAYRALVFNGLLDPAVFTPKVAAAVRRALELDEYLADAHAALGTHLRDVWDWTGAARAYQRAIELNPSLSAAHGPYSALLSSLGRHDEAVATAVRARELDPLNPLAGTSIGQKLYYARRYDDAIEILTRELDRGLEFTPVFLGYTYSAKGMYADAIAAYRLAMERGDKTTSTQVYLGAACARAGDRRTANAILAQLQATDAYVSHAELAVLYHALGDTDRAFMSLEKAFAARDPQLQFLGVDLELDGLRQDPRFADLMRRVGLPQAQGSPASQSPGPR